MKINENFLQDPDFIAYENLDERYQTAIDLRLDGFRYKYIAAVLKVKEQTVAVWFAKGGICEKAYRQRKKIWRRETRKIFKEIEEQIREGAVDSLVTLKKAIRRGSITAAIDMLDRAGFKPKEKVEIETPTDRKIDKLGEIISNLGQYAKSELTSRNTKSA